MVKLTCLIPQPGTGGPNLCGVNPHCGRAVPISSALTRQLTSAASKRKGVFYVRKRFGVLSVVLGLCLIFGAAAALARSVDRSALSAAWEKIGGLTGVELAAGGSGEGLPAVAPEAKPEVKAQVRTLSETFLDDKGKPLVSLKEAFAQQPVALDGQKPKEIQVAANKDTLAGTKAVSRASSIPSEKKPPKPGKAAVPRLAATGRTANVSRAGGSGTVVTADGRELRYRRMYEAVATGYGSEVAKPGREPIVAWRGLKLRPGMIAVDPDLIPLGSRVYVTGYNHPNLPQGGFVGLAADVGSAIQGNRIDIFVEGTPRQVWSFGNQNVKVYLLASE